MSNARMKRNRDAYNKRIANIRQRSMMFNHQSDRHNKHSRFEMFIMKIVNLFHRLIGR